MDKYCRINYIRGLHTRKLNKRAWRWATLRGLPSLSCADLS